MRADDTIMKINQADWNKFEEYMLGELDYMIRNLINDFWQIELEFSQEPYPTITEREYGGNAETDYDYRKHKIMVYQKVYRKNWLRDKSDKKNYKEIILWLIHEYCHQYFTPIAEMAMLGNKKNDYVGTLNERTTEIVAHNYYKFLYHEDGKRKFK